MSTPAPGGASQKRLSPPESRGLSSPPTNAGRRAQPVFLGPGLMAVYVVLMMRRICCAWPGQWAGITHSRGAGSPFQCSLVPSSGVQPLAIPRVHVRSVRGAPVHVLAGHLLERCTDGSSHGHPRISRFIEQAVDRICLSTKYLISQGPQGPIPSPAPQYFPRDRPPRRPAATCCARPSDRGPAPLPTESLTMGTLRRRGCPQLAATPTPGCAHAAHHPCPPPGGLHVEGRPSITHNFEYPARRPARCRPTGPIPAI